MLHYFTISNIGPVNEPVTLSFEATADHTLEDYYVVLMPDGTRLLKTAYIYGPNASGKSTLLFAINLLRTLITQPPAQKNRHLGFTKHLLGDAPQRPAKIHLAWYLEDIRYTYTLEFDEDRIRSEELYYYPYNRKARVFERRTTEGVSYIEFGSTIDLTKKDAFILEGNTIPNNTVLGAYSKTNISNAVLERLFSWFDKALLPLIAPKTDLFAWTTEYLDRELFDRRKFIDLLRKADLHISDLEVTENEFELNEELREHIDRMPISESEWQEILAKKKLVAREVRFHHEFRDEAGGSRKMELGHSEESGGTRRFYELSGPLLFAIENDSILCIDEMEASLHPDLYKHFVLTFLANAGQAQLIFTSHNTSFLNERDIIRNDAVWFTEKDREGGVRLYSAADFKTSEIRKNTSLFNAYRLGKMGATPNLSELPVIK